MDESRSSDGNLPPDAILHNQLGDRYDVLERLGDGPLVVSYRGRDRTLNRLVTIKTLLPAFAQNQPVRERLRNGLGRTLALSSPRIVRAYDVGTHETGSQSLLFWVEEYVRGINLKERIRRAAPFQTAAAIDTLIPLAEALEYAHSRGIPHGDIRPQNVLIGPDGELKLTGFGIADAQALAIRDEPQLIRRIDSYAAPELAPSSLASADADLFALGVILFELLTGEVPRYNSGVGSPTWSAYATPTFETALLGASLPKTIGAIIGKATMERPADRYRSASEFLVDLRAVREALQSGKPLTWNPIESSRVSEAERLTGPSQPALPAGVPRMPSGQPGLAGETRRAPSIGSDPTIAMAVPPPQRPARPASDVRFVGESLTGGPTRSDERSSVTQGMRTSGIEEKDEPPLRRDYQQSENGGGGNRYLTSLNLFLFVLVVAGLGVLGFMTTSFLKPAPEVVVPNLVGKTITDAKELASEEKFDLAVVDEPYRDSDAAGVIYQMQPAPGRHIREGKPISIWVSKGPHMIDVPDVRSTTLEKARQLIESSNLKLGDYTFQYDAVEPKGNVLSQDPPAGESRPHGTKIALVLSKGEEPAPTPVPDLPPPPIPNTPDPTPPPVDTPTDHAAPPSPAATDADSDSRLRYFDIKYPIPGDNLPHRIRIDVTDRDGTKTVFDETHKTGETVKQRITAIGKQIHIRVFDNDQLQAEIQK